MRSGPTRRRTILAAAAATALVAAGCIPYDLTGTLGADHVYVDPAGVWRVFGTDEAIWTGPTVPSTPGTNGRYPAPGNYDGEGRWEPAVVDVTTGVWTTAGARGTFTFPAPADPSPGISSETGDVVAVPGDYDGDGDTDPAYFVEDTATWHIEGQDPFTFGNPTTGPDTLVIRGATVHDIAAPADYDGDGDWDPAVYHPHNGDIDVLGEAAPRRTNLPWSLPAPADYHGTPAADASALGLLWQGWAVEGEPLILQQRYLPGGGWWQGLVAGIPAPADYDGDGDTEEVLVAVDGSKNLVVDGAVLGAFAMTHSVATPPSITANVFDVSKWGNECAHAIRFECPGEDAYFVTTTTTLWIPTSDYSPLPAVIHTPVGGIPVRGDYDGDGTPEPAVYLEATGQWATNGTRGTFTYPAPPDTDTDPTTTVYPIPADYDGDGDWDPAFYRDADATWHIEGHTPTQHGRPTSTTPTFGTGTPIHDIPVPGDYDADGDWDLATYQPDTGQHHIAGHTPTTPPWPIGEPAVADMNADGADDLVIWDDADGTGVLHTIDGPRYYRHPLETHRGAPAPGDWDGDGDREIAILDDASGPWRNLSLPSVNRLAKSGGVYSDYVHPTTGQLVVSRPAFGRWETFANHAYLDGYVAACITPAHPPTTCP